MKWATKTVSITEWQFILNVLEAQVDTLHLASGQLPEVLLVEGGSLERQEFRLFLGLPEGSGFASYAGFIEIGEDKLPKQATFSGGREDIFQKIFHPVPPLGAVINIMAVLKESMQKRSRAKVRGTVNTRMQCLV